MIKIVDDLLNWVVGLSEGDKEVLRAKDRSKHDVVSTGTPAQSDEV